MGFATCYQVGVMLWFMQPGLLEWLCPVVVRLRRDGYHPGTYGGSDRTDA